MSSKPERKNEYTSEEAEKVKELAELGNADAQRELGLMYSDGIGVPQDDVLALMWWRVAASQGHAGGQNGLGWAYLNGKGVKQDLALAVKWVKTAAEQGYAKSQMNMGLLCMGKGISTNLEEAEKWFELAAAQGYPGAERKLIEVRRRKEMTENNVKLEEYTINECAECGRVNGVNGNFRETTFSKEDISFWERSGKDTPDGGKISIVKTVKSSYCRHCHPEDKDAAEIRERSYRKWDGKIFKTEDFSGSSVFVKPFKGHVISLTMKSDKVSFTNSMRIGGSFEGSELTQDEFLEQTQRFGEEYDKVFGDLKRSRGEFDWRSMINKKEGSVWSEVNDGMPKEDSWTMPFSTYRCAYCNGWYSTEENARKCVLSCKAKFEAEMKEKKDPKRKAPLEDMIIHKPWTCSFCSCHYKTESEAKECAAECKLSISKDWAGKIFLLQWKSKWMDAESDFKDIWVIAGEQSTNVRLDAMWIRSSQDGVSVSRRTGFYPNRWKTDIKELTEDEFMEQVEQVYTEGRSMLFDMENSRGDFDWRSMVEEKGESD